MQDESMIDTQSKDDSPQSSPTVDTEVEAPEQRNAEFPQLRDGEIPTRNADLRKTTRSKKEYIPKCRKH
jgi:hypothetical protein